MPDIYLARALAAALLLGVRSPRKFLGSRDILLVEESVLDFPQRLIRVGGQLMMVRNRRITVIWPYKLNEWGVRDIQLEVLRARGLRKIYIKFIVDDTREA